MFVLQNLFARLLPRRGRAEPRAAAPISTLVAEPAQISLMDLRLATLGVVLARLDQRRAQNSVTLGGRR